MKNFKLPDLGEGLPDAIIREWYVKVGDVVEVDQPIVAMETAKALVDVPAPFPGTIEKLYGDEGDTIETGKPLIGFEGEGEEEVSKDTGTVVGAIEEGGVDLEQQAQAAVTNGPAKTGAKATPAVRALAKRLGVDISQVPSTGERITANDVKAFAEQAPQKTAAAPRAAPSTAGYQPLSQARKAMVQSMSLAHQQVVPVSIVDDADLFAWDDKQDFSVRLLRAIAKACQAEPLLNASLNGDNYTYCENPSINIGLAIDTPHGLFVPVLKDVGNISDKALREKINEYKVKAKDKTFSREDLQDATISLSNVGTIGGRYATPAIIPPMVAILAVGKLRNEVVAHEGAPAIHPILPLSLTFDHRLVTGGEAARFLHSVIDAIVL